MKKVIARLGNGLGNQLFTYATAYSFAKTINSKLYIDDKSGFYKRFKYELHNFNIKAPLADRKEKFIGKLERFKRKFLIKIDKYKNNKNFLIEERDKNKLSYYNPNQFNINFNKTIFFEGYFQSEKYFSLYKKELLSQFTFKQNIQNQKNKFLNSIKNSNSISIHIRQNKFLADEGHKNLKKLNTEYVKDSIDNIKKAVLYFDEHIQNPIYFIWSNDFTNLKEIFPSNKYIFVDVNLNNEAALDLYLMSQCKHFILSSSTFHYWGAFLSNNKNRICVGPKYMLNKSGYYGFSNNKDIKPSWWIEI